MKTGFAKGAALLAALFFAASVTAQDIDKLKTGGPYVPTPQVVVDQMLKMGAVTDKDYVIDLGSGDGVIVLTAARQFKAGGMGIEIDPDLVRQSNASAQKSGVADRVHFAQLDVFKADLSKASVLTLYLLPGMMLNLRTKIFTELKPGVRVVSHDYHFGEWSADDTISFDVAEKEMITGVPRATVYRWNVPAKVAGGETYELELKQRFQNITESIGSVNGRLVRPQAVSVKGGDISFTLPDGKTVGRFTGRVNGEAMEGTVDLSGAKPATAKWTATRIAVAKVVVE